MSATLGASVIRNAPPKPVKGTRKRLKARGQRQEAKVKKSVRAACVERDGYCLLLTRWPDQGAPADRSVFSMVPACGGPSEWAHIGKHRRCHTRGQAPEARHTTKGSGMLCERHHDAYDSHAFDIEATTAVGMDGAFRVVAR